jgi:hypothetical protein
MAYLRKESGKDERTLLVEKKFQEYFSVTRMGSSPSQFLSAIRETLGLWTQ